jgi:prevent-host-death family protein
MQTISSSEARNNLAAMLEKAQHEPIAIQKQGRNTAVLLSYEEYERLTGEPVRRFQDICDRIGRNARERGLTDEIFNEIMAQRNE